jgi:hypothetical protein
MHAKPETSLRLLLTRQEPEARNASAESNDEAGYVSLGHGRIGNRPQLSLLFTKSDGSGKAVAYNLFCGIEFDNPDEGFTLLFSTCKVVIAGRNLKQLLRRICQHRQAEIVEVGQRAALGAPPGEPVVETITFPAGRL